MFGYEYDVETGGLLLNDSTPNSSKEPRPVYATEMLMLHMDEWFSFAAQDDRPYMWAEAANYYYRGKLVAKTKGGSLCVAPVMDYVVATTEQGEKVPAVPKGFSLDPVDIDRMVEKNVEMMAIIEQATVKKIYDYWKRYQKRLDCFHVAFSGGKDSMVLLELVKKALPRNAFMVVFGDTKMEFPDTYKLVDIVEKQCKEDGIAFYRAASHLDPEESWRLFGPPSRTIRWCCTVHKAAPQTLKIREILGLEDYRGAVFLGVRAHESLKRSKYDFEEQSKKQKGQQTLSPILDWTTAEIWQYIYSRKLPINGCYKKGNSRAGCLFCPQGEGKSESIRRMSYPDETKLYMDLIADTTSSDDLNAYVNKGGWIGRKNGQKLAGARVRYRENIVGDEFVITVDGPQTDWREWIKTMGDVPFPFRVVDIPTGYEVHAPAYIDGTTEGKHFKQVFRKAAYCVGCKVCESNCRYGCIHFDNGLRITGCRHCLQCHEVNEGCWAYASLYIPITGGVKKMSINVLNDHAPKPDWIDGFFSRGSEYLIKNTLGPDQDTRFKRFLKTAGLIDKEATTPLYDLIKTIGVNTDTAWGLIYVILAYDNPQIRWYVEKIKTGEVYKREAVQEILITSEGLTEKVASQIIRAFKRLTEIPLGTVLHMGTTAGRSVDTLSRTKCSLHDDRVLLYSLYRYAEACQDYYEFSLARLMNTSIDSAGISPVKLFGFTEDEMITMLNGLSAKYPEFINVTFTHGLDKISLRDDKTADDVLKLFS